MSYPERLADVSPALDLAKIGTLTFEEPDTDRFPCLAYAFEALKTGGTMPAVVSAANEVAVKYFLDEKIGYGAICARDQMPRWMHNSVSYPHSGGRAQSGSLGEAGSGKNNRVRGQVPADVVQKEIANCGMRRVG